MEAFEITEIVPVLLPPVLGEKAAPKVKLCPAVKVSGRLRPVTVKLVLETLACVIVTLALPVFVKVSDWVLLPPTATLAKVRLESLVLSTPAGAAPTPALSGTVSVGSEALLMTARLPVLEVAAAGAV